MALEYFADVAKDFIAMIGDGMVECQAGALPQKNSNSVGIVPQKKI